MTKFVALLFCCVVGTHSLGFAAAKSTDSLDAHPNGFWNDVGGSDIQMRGERWIEPKIALQSPTGVGIDVLGSVADKKVNE